MKYKFNREEVEQKLVSLEATQPCSRCGHDQFGILPGISTIYLNDEFNSDVIKYGSDSQVPVIYISCTNCGALTMHGIGGLGLVDFATDKSKVE